LEAAALEEMQLAAAAALVEQADLVAIYQDRQQLAHLLEEQSASEPMW
jgi:hypothetical protein